MAELLKLREAARLIGVSPGRLYHAIADGGLTAAPGGGPGKPTLVSLEAVQTFCRSEGLRVPESSEVVGRLARSARSRRSERVERSANPADDTLAVQALETLTGQYLAQILARQSDYIETFVRQELSHLVERVVEQVMERLTERFTTLPPSQTERPERPERLKRSTPNEAAATGALLPHRTPRCCSDCERCRPKVSPCRPSPISSMPRTCPRSAARAAGRTGPSASS